MPTVSEYLKHKVLGRSGRRVAWERAKRNIRMWCPNINLGILDQGLGPLLDSMTSLYAQGARAGRAEFRRQPKGTDPTVLDHEVERAIKLNTRLGERYWDELMEVKQSIMNVLASYERICLQQVKDSEDLKMKQGWTSAREAVMDERNNVDRGLNIGSLVSAAKDLETYPELG